MPVLAAPEQSTHTSPSQFDSEKAWQEFEEKFRLFYAYLDQSKTNVDLQFSRSKMVALAATNEAEFRKILHQTLLTFTDQHLSISPFDETYYSITPTGADMAVDYDGRDFTVSDVRAGSAADARGIRPGWKILSADGLAIADAAQKPFGATLPQPNQRQLAFGAKLAVSGLRNRNRKLAFDAGGKTVSVDLPSTYAFSDALRKKPLLAVSKHGEIAVIRINNSLGDNDLIGEFDRAMAMVADSAGLILDLRNTPSGGNTEVARSIIGHFVSEIRPYQVHEIPSLEREFTVPRRFIEMVFPRGPNYNKPLVVLGGRWTGSMGEGLVIGLDAATNAHVIASDMGDLLGALSNFKLEYSNAQLNMGTESLFHVNGTPREDYVADHPLKSADRAPDGSDPAMSHALVYFVAAD